MNRAPYCPLSMTSGLPAFLEESQRSLRLFRRCLEQWLFSACRFISFELESLQRSQSDVFSRLCRWTNNVPCEPDSVHGIINMKICKAPTQRLNALNKHSTHNVHRDGECYSQFNKSQHIMYTSTWVQEEEEEGTTTTTTTTTTSYPLPKDNRISPAFPFVFHPSERPQRWRGITYPRKERKREEEKNTPQKQRNTSNDPRFLVDVVSAHVGRAPGVYITCITFSLASVHIASSRAQWSSVCCYCRISFHKQHHAMMRKCSHWRLCVCRCS